MLHVLILVPFCNLFAFSRIYKRSMKTLFHRNTRTIMLSLGSISMMRYDGGDLRARQLSRVGAHIANYSALPLKRSN